MSITAPTSSSPPASPGQTRSSLLLVRVLLAGAVLAFLLVRGIQGRQEARRQAQLVDIGFLRDQVLLRLDQAEANAETLPVLTTTGPASPRPKPLRPPETQTWIETLRSHLDQFSRHARQDRLSSGQDVELRISKATLAVADGKFEQALTTVTPADEKVQGAAAGRAEKLRDILRIRADSLYALSRWAEAAGRYQQLATRHTNETVVLARAADCLGWLGKRDEAVNAYHDLAARYGKVGDGRLLAGNVGAAVAEYDKALRLLTALVEQTSRRDLALPLALSYDRLGSAFLLERQVAEAMAYYDKAVDALNRNARTNPPAAITAMLARCFNHQGDAWLLQGKPAPAIPFYDKALEWRLRLNEAGGGNQDAAALAMTLNNRGNALLGVQKLDAAWEHYDKAATIRTRLIEQAGQAHLSDELALTLNNRGVVRRALGKVSEARADFDAAIQLLERTVQLKSREVVPAATPEVGAAGSLLVGLDVVIGYWEREIEVLSRPVILQQDAKEPAVALGMCLRNIGFLDLAQGKVDLARTAFQKAIEIYERLVGLQGQKDLSPHLAKTLAALGWIYATYPDDSVRDGTKARQFAVRACELADWQSYQALDALAAAYAQNSLFTEAVTSQEKAIAIAPPKQQPELRARLELYKAGRPYRTPGTNRP